jgi:inner membrane protein involved in colicin E2 resistance
MLLATTDYHGFFIFLFLSVGIRMIRANPFYLCSIFRSRRKKLTLTWLKLAPLSGPAILFGLMPGIGSAERTWRW